MSLVAYVKEKCRLKSELEDVKRRLSQAEKEVLSTKDECIQLHEANQTLHKEVSVTFLLIFLLNLVFCI